MNPQLSEWLDAANNYFGSLTDNEKYGWVAEVLGFLLLIVGIVLLLW